MKPHNYMSRERGASLVQTVLALVVLFGFVALAVEYGSMVVRHQRLQGAADAGALAAGPLLPHLTNGTSTAAGSPQVVAETFAQSNSAIVGKVTASGEASTYTLTVTAWDSVPTPFLSVLSGQASRTVSAVTRIKADPNLNPAWLAPLAIQHSYLSEDMSKLWGKPAELLMQMSYQGNYPNGEWDYVSDPGTPWTGNEAVLQANCIALDLKNTSRSGPAGYEQALADYMNYMLNGITGPVVYDPPNATKNINVSSLRFTSLDAWETTTLDIFNDIVSQSAAYTDETWQHFDGNNPRFVVLTLINRTTGTGKKEFDCNFVGYVGFFIEDVGESELTADTLAIKGRFVEYSGPRPPSQGGYPPSDLMPGLFTFGLID